MAELLYMNDCYKKEFDAGVVSAGEGYVVLDRTAFYPEGGGQESDTGRLNGVKVTKVKKVGEEVRHYVEAPLEGGVHGTLDWDERYSRMRMHTAQHLLSSIVLDEYGAETMGNQIHSDRSRMDFALDSMPDEMISRITKKFNECVDRKLPVNIYIASRDEVVRDIDERRRKLFERVPSFVKEVRVVEIGGVDKCPCAGTHVANTGEIGHIKVEKSITKGKGITRIVFGLVK